MAGFDEVDPKDFDPPSLEEVKPEEFDQAPKPETPHGGLSDFAEAAKYTGSQLLRSNTELASLASQKAASALNPENAQKPGASLLERAGGIIGETNPLLQKAVSGIASASSAVAGKAKNWEDEAMAAMSPEWQASAQKQFIEKDAAGNHHLGEGFTDPVSLGLQAAQVLPMMAEGWGAAGLAARTAYATRYGAALAETAAKRMPQSLALKYAESEAQKAGMKAAVVAGGITEGNIGGGQTASQVQDTLNNVDENTLSQYRPYNDLRAKGLAHEAARAEVAKDHALAAGLSAAAITGLTGSPLNAYLGKWVNAAARNRLASAGTGALIGGAAGGAQNTAQQVAANVAEQPITGAGTWDNAIEAGLTGTIFGAALGGLAGAAAPHGTGEPEKAGQSQLDLEDAKTSAGLSMTEYQQAKANYEALAAKANDPTVPTTRDALDEAKQRLQQATVNLGHDALLSGKLDDTTQKQIAGALQDARKQGITPDDKAADIAPGVDHETLTKIANAEPVEQADLHDLISGGLAKMGRDGRPMLLPQGRRLLTALDTKAAVDEAAAVQKKAVSTESVQAPKVNKLSAEDTADLLKKGIITEATAKALGKAIPKEEPAAVPEQTTPAPSEQNTQKLLKLPAEKRAARAAAEAEAQNRIKKEADLQRAYADREAQMQAERDKAFVPARNQVGEQQLEEAPYKAPPEPARAMADAFARAQEKASRRGADGELSLAEDLPPAQHEPFQPEAKRPEDAKVTEGPATVPGLYRGVEAGRSADGFGDTLGGARFYTPDQETAKTYAGNDGRVSQRDVEFKKLLSGETLEDLRAHLRVKPDAELPEIMDAARKKGYDGLRYDLKPGVEYVELSPKQHLVDKVADRVRKSLGANVTVVDTPADLPNVGNLRLPDTKGAFVENPDGSKQLFMVRSTHADELDATKTAVHEIVGHDGLRGLLGKGTANDKYSSTMKQIRDSYPNLLQRLAKSQHIPFDHPDPATRERMRNLAAEELVAYSTEKLLTSGKKQSIYAKVVAKIRDVLRNLGMLKGFNKGDIEDLIYSARDYVVNRNLKGEIAQAKYEGDVNVARGEEAAAAREKSGDPDLDSFLGKIGAPQKSWAQRWEGLKNAWAERLTIAGVDDLYGIKAAETEAGVPVAEHAYIDARMSRNSALLAQAIATHGEPDWLEGAPTIKEGTLGLQQILAPIKDKIDLFGAYRVGRRAQRLAAEGRENLFSPAEIAAAVRLGDQHPELQVANKALDKLQKSVLDFAENAGYIDPESRKLWEHGDYVPFYRLMEDQTVAQSTNSGALGKTKAAFKRLKGGTENIGDPLENILRNWLSLADGSLKANATRKIVDNLNGTGKVVKVKGGAPAGMPNPEVPNILKSAGVDPAKLGPEAMVALEKMAEIPPKVADNVITVWRGGKKEQWTVHDPLLMRSMLNVGARASDPLMAAFRFPKRIFTATVTATPTFMLSNAFRDMLHGWIQGSNSGKATITPFKDFPKGFLSSIQQDRTYQALMASGGLFEHGYIHGGDLRSGAAALKRAAGATPRSWVLDTPARAVAAYRKLLASSENASRISMYNNLRAKGVSHREASFEARDMLDFSMRGDNSLVKFLIESVPFVNAREQGLYRLGKAFRQNPYGMLMRGSLLALASTALAWKNAYNPKYQELTNDQKNNYWHLFNVFSPGDHIQIPKPFEAGVIFGTVPEAIVDFHRMNAEEPDRAQQAGALLSNAISQTLSFAPYVQAINPVLELGMNKNFSQGAGWFQGPPILNQGDLGRLPQDQDSPSVHPTFRALSRLAPKWGPEALQSPKQLQFLAQGYVGNIMDYALLITDKLSRQALDEPPPPEVYYKDWPGLSTYYKSGPSRHTKYMDAMFDIVQQAAKVHSSMQEAEKGGDADRYLQIAQENQPQEIARSSFTKAEQEVLKLRKQQRMLQQDGTMDPKSRRDLSDQLQETMNEIARSVYDIRPGSKLNPEMAVSLLGQPPAQSAQTLRSAGLPSTADLVEAQQ